MERRERAQHITKSHVVWAVGAGFMPIPLLDIAAVTAIQLDMLRQLASVYELNFHASEGKAWVSALTGSVVARLGANALKLIPGVGSLVGGVSMAVMSGASTYALGQVVATHLEGGGTFATLDLEWAKRVYGEQFEKGKDVASRVANDKSGSRDVFEKLEKLGQLRDKGVISAEEFEAQKKKLLEMV